MKINNKRLLSYRQDGEKARKTMEVYVCEYDTGWKVNKCETEKMRVLPNHMAQKTDFIYNGCFGHINEMFLTEQDAWESIKEKRMDKRYYLDYDGKIKPYI